MTAFDRHGRCQAPAVSRGADGAARDIGDVNAGAKRRAGRERLAA